MVEYMDTLSQVLKATSDSTRRDILTLLCQQGGCRVTDLARHYSMSLNAVSKHIKVLEAAGLIKRTPIGRIHMIEANLEPLSQIEQWLSTLQSIWALRFRCSRKFSR